MEQEVERVLLVHLVIRENLEPEGQMGEMEGEEDQVNLAARELLDQEVILVLQVRLEKWDSKDLRASLDQLGNKDSEEQWALR